MCSSSACHSTDEQLFIEKQLFPKPRLLMKMNSCYPNSSLPSDFWHQSIISLHVRHADNNIAQNKWVLFHSNLPGGWAIFQFCRSLWTPWLDRIVYILADFSLATFAAYPPPTFGVFFCWVSFTYFDFWSDGFNIGQMKSTVDIQ